ncbi:hypothetical protein [Amycolatopsis sp. NPDC051903]
MDNAELTTATHPRIQHANGAETAEKKNPGRADRDFFLPEVNS